MAEFTQLRHPPLKEALVDIHLAEELPISFADKLEGHSVEEGQALQKIMRMHGKLSLPLGVETGKATCRENVNEAFGWRRTLAKGAQVAQLKRDGITVSILRDYSNWMGLKKLTQEVWNQYCALGMIGEIDRLVIRYVNVLELPLGNTNFDEYLTAGPHVPSPIPQLIGGFFFRVLVPFTEANAVAVVTQALEQPSQTRIPIVLDIEVTSNGRMAHDSPGIWTQLDALHEIKNLIFFSFVTEKALEPYR